MCRTGTIPLCERKLTIHISKAKKRISELWRLCIISREEISDLENIIGPHQRNDDLKNSDDCWIMNGLRKHSSIQLTVVIIQTIICKHVSRVELPSAE